MKIIFVGNQYRPVIRVSQDDPDEHCVTMKPAISADVTLFKREKNEARNANHSEPR